MINYIYCTQCRGKLDISSQYPKCPDCEITYYRNSKPCVGILPIKNGKVLLAKRAIEPFKDAYDIIGGFLEEGESPQNGAMREFAEETGARVKVGDFLGIYMDRYGEEGDYTLNIYYVGTDLEGDILPMEDVSSLEWFDIDKLPEKIAFNHTSTALSDLKKWYMKKVL